MLPNLDREDFSATSLDTKIGSIEEINAAAIGYLYGSSTSYQCRCFRGALLYVYLNFRGM